MLRWQTTLPAREDEAVDLENAQGKPVRFDLVDLPLLGRRDSRPPVASSRSFLKDQMAQFVGDVQHHAEQSLGKSLGRRARGDMVTDNVSGNEPPVPGEVGGVDDCPVKAFRAGYQDNVLAQAVLHGGRHGSESVLPPSRLPAYVGGNLPAQCLEIAFRPPRSCGPRGQSPGTLTEMARRSAASGGPLCRTSSLLSGLVRTRPANRKQVLVRSPSDSAHVNESIAPQGIGKLVSAVVDKNRDHATLSSIGGIAEQGSIPLHSDPVRLERIRREQQKQRARFFEAALYLSEDVIPRLYHPSVKPDADTVGAETRGELLSLPLVLRTVAEEHVVSKRLARRAHGHPIDHWSTQCSQSPGA